ncbi:MAG TPA: metallophosphoesterase, partial [Gemmatimonadaceae bacterium]|nr:metallophosphoesterase [Gemmatimonadaceae bacterium]
MSRYRMQRTTDRERCALVVGWLLLVLWTLPPSILAADENLEAPPEGAFTIVVIPDTQNYVGSGTKRTPESTEPVTNDYFATHTRWIVDNLARQRIVFVSHVGDIVDKNNDAQWQVARQCMDTLHGKVPYGITVGNHDMKSDGDSSRFQQFFPADRFRGFPWYGGCFEPDRSDTSISGNNANSFQLFSAEGLDFVILHLECNAPDDVLA